MTLSPRIAVTAAILVGAYLRIGVALERSLTIDEAYNGVDALRVLAGHQPVFFAQNNGREPLYIYLVAWTTSVLGTSPLAVRLPAALAGLVGIAGVAAFGRELFRYRRGGPWLGAYAAAFAAVLPWQVVIDRLGLRLALMGPCLVVAATLTLLGLRASEHRRGLARFLGAGFFAALALYTYLPARLAPLVLAFVIAGALWPGSNRIRASRLRLALGFTCASLAALATAWPILAYFASHPAAIGLRAGQVSAFSQSATGESPLTVVAKNSLATLGMFLQAGDPGLPYNVPDRPAFAGAAGAAFLVGCVVGLTGRYRRGASVLVAWVACMALPGILSERAPHFGRQVGMLPALALVPALALDWLRVQAGRHGPWAGVGLLCLVLAAGLRDTRVLLPQTVGNVTSLESLLADWELLYVADSEEAAVATAYLSGLSPRVKPSHGFQSAIVPTTVTTATVVVIGRDWYTDLARRQLERFLSLEEFPLPSGLEKHRGFRIHSARAVAGAANPVARWELGPELIWAELQAEADPGDELILSLLWRVGSVAPAALDPGDDFAWFAHLLTEAGDFVTGHDWLGFPTYAWQAGDSVMSWFTLRLPKDQTCGRLQAYVGLYSRITGARSPVVRAGRLSPLGDAWPVGSLMVCRAQTPGG